MNQQNEQGQAPGAVLLNVAQVARLLNCSARQIYRLSDAGRMPGPVRLGGLVRWPLGQLESWIFEGCPSCREAGRS